MSNIVWCNLFYDKYIGDNNSPGDHHFKSKITSKISMEDLEDGSYNYFTGKVALEKYNTKFNSVTFILPKLLQDCPLFKVHMYCKKLNELDTIFIVIGINTNLLEKYVHKYIELNEPIPYQDFIKILCRYHLQYTNENKCIMNSFYYNSSSVDEKIKLNTNYIIEKAMTAVDYAVDNRINIKELTLQLFEYQKCSICWMINKEKNIERIYYNLNDEVILGNVYCDLFNQKFNYVSKRKQLIFKGGCLIDEVGLGKTLQIISLVLSNPCKNISYVREENKQKFFSRATLIFCPNQLCGQWARELRDKISKDYDANIITIMTKKDFDRITYNDLLDADFVLVSFTFLDNKVFTIPWTSKVSTLKNYHKKVWTSADHLLISKTFEDMGKELLEDPFASLNKKQPFIQLIHWHRFVIDEFHEIYKDRTTYEYIANINKHISSDYKWVVTATPFTNTKSLYEIVNFITNYKNYDEQKILTLEKVVDHLSTSIFRRNTKESVKKEHTIPPIKEEIRWLKFSPTERMIYNAYIADPNNSKFSIYLRQLCCHPQLADETKEALGNCKTLEDIEKMMVGHYKLQMDDAQEKVDKINERITKINKKIKKMERKQKKKQMKKMGLKVEESDTSNSDNDSGSDNEEDLAILLGLDDNTAGPAGSTSLITMSSITLDKLKETVKNYEIQLKESVVVLDGKKSTYNFFNNVLERIRKTVNKETSTDKNIEIDDMHITDIFNKQSIDFEDDDEEDDDDEKEDEEVCGICLDEIPENDIGVTKCGHIFCFECLKLTITKYHSCPYCKSKLNDKDIYILSYERKKKTNISQEDKNKNDLINEIGTKLANLILFLRETKEHSIIFSQWDDLLRRVGRILKENNIPNVFCKGHCYQRDKAIRDFNDDDKIKVIMLSSDSTAAGTNLTKASQVIFIDPIYGTYDFRKGQERQAVGRAHRLGQKANIKVIRFIIKDSVEEEIYKMNLSEDSKFNNNDFLSTQEIHLV